MSYYPINFSEPLKTGFQVTAGSSDGPGGPVAHTSLRIYGQGALEWGEAVDEDLVRLSENFASASPPPSPIHGQFWYEISLYYRDTSLGNVLEGWWVFDPNTLSWSMVNTTGVVSSTASATDIYYFDSTASVLYGFFSLVTGLPQSYVPRSYKTGSGAPTTLIPQQTLWVWDAFANNGAGNWIPPSTIVESQTAPTSPQPTALWYNPSTNTLSMWNGISWVVVMLSGSTGVVVPGNIDMQNLYKVINLPTPVNSSDAATKGYVDGLVGSSVGGFLPTTGGTITGSLAVDGIATFNAVVSINASPTLNGNVLRDVASGIAATDGVNLGQVQQLIAGGISGASTSNIPQIIVNSAQSYKACDMSIVNGVVYIATASGTGLPPGGNWKQVYPAVYSA